MTGLGDTQRPLYADANRKYLENRALLEKTRQVFSRLEMDIGGVSIKSGYSYYLFMKLLRGVAAQGTSAGRGRGVGAIGNSLRQIMRADRLPQGQSGSLRLDYPVDLYEGPTGFYNKNISADGTALIVAIPAMPAMAAPDQLHVGQGLKILEIARWRNIRWGREVFAALAETGISVSRRRFWRHHLIYCARLAGFEAVFDRVFAENRFDDVHFTRFADLSMQGMLLAAKRYGVRSIEYQHGVISPLHPAIALADFATKATMPDRLMVTSPIYAKLSYGRAEIIAPPGEAVAFGGDSEAQHGILVAMQPRFSGDAVDLALRLARDFPGLSFTLRGHPRAKPSRAELAAIEQRRNLSYEAPETVESSVSLGGRAGHITGSSTMGLSAALQGIRSLFLHREGYDQALMLMGSGGARANVAYAETYEELRAWLEAGSMR